MRPTSSPAECAQCRKASGMGIELGVPAPPVPRVVRARSADRLRGDRGRRRVVDALVVGVDGDRVERDVLLAEAMDEAVPVVGPVRPPAREPDPERLAGQHRGRSGERAQVPKGARVVAAVREQIEVLVVAFVCGAHLEVVPRDQRRRAVVEQVPTGAREHALMQRHPAAGEVERAAPAAERIGIGAGTWRQLSLADANPEAPGGERAGVAAPAQGQPRRADDPSVPVDLRLEGDRLRGPFAVGGERAPVLELAIGRVLEPDQRWGDDLEARRPVDDRRTWLCLCRRRQADDERSRPREDYRSETETHCRGTSTSTARRDTRRGGSGGIFRREEPVVVAAALCEVGIAGDPANAQHAHDRLADAPRKDRAELEAHSL